MAIKKRAQPARAGTVRPAAEHATRARKRAAHVDPAGVQGDAEDRAGRPFVGPAGRLLDAALVEVGVDRRTCYVTNAVKHFKWGLRGKRRTHKTPAQREIEACSQWLEGELAAIDPGLVVCLGATAARAVLGPQARVGALRGKMLSAPAPAARGGLAHPPRAVLVTVHPPMILRAPPEERAAARAAFVDDLRCVAQYLTHRPGDPSPPFRPSLEGKRSEIQSR